MYTGLKAWAIKLIQDFSGLFAKPHSDKDEHSC
jgi:hypothetical protein